MRTIRLLPPWSAALLLAAAVAGCQSDHSVPAPVGTTIGASSSLSGSLSGAAKSVDSVLPELVVKGRAAMTGYSRDQFGPAWTDDNDDTFGHNGCDTRNDILRRDLTATTLDVASHDCVVLTGVLHDPYSGKTITFTRGAMTSNAVEIDHVVALGDAWQLGAQGLSPRDRQNLANDPLNLLAVDGAANQAKGDSDAASWLPANKSYRCAYVARQVAVKAKYRLAVTSAELAAIRRQLSMCPGQALPTA